MSNRKIITIVIVALLFGGLFLLYNRQAKLEAEQNAQILGYEPEVFLQEGGYTAARNYADSIFTELYCNTRDIVYQYAFTENNIDIPHRELIASIMLTSPTENHLYLKYRIPTVANERDENGKPTSNWSYTGGYVYAVMDMRNISRNSAENYSCGEFSILTENIDTVLSKVMDTNGSTIESDGELRKMIDYGVIYTVDDGITASLVEREKNRISSYLLAEQKANAGAYVFSTTGESVSANTTDRTATINRPDGRKNEEQSNADEEINPYAQPQGEGTNVQPTPNEQSTAQSQ
jgi:hypothetical protein